MWEWSGGSVQEGRVGGVSILLLSVTVQLMFAPAQRQYHQVGYGRDGKRGAFPGDPRW
jgi:hypothetical protein